MSKTITNSYSTGITLTSGDNPVTVTGTGTIAANEVFPAIYGRGGSTNTWTIHNSGRLTNSYAGSYGYGIVLGSGTPTNLTAVVSGTVTNSGVIAGGANGGGVGIVGPGYVSNAPSGTITGGSNGVFFEQANFTAQAIGTVINSGSINGAGITGSGVYLEAGGTVTNNAGAIRGGDDGVLIGTIAPGTVTNFSSISGTNDAGVFLGAGGTVTNSGLASDIIGNFGVFLNDGGTVHNQGHISGAASGVVANGATGSVDNSGTINGSGAYGIALSDSGNVANQGVITQSGVGPEAAGVYLGGTPGGGTVDNLGSGTISGVRGVYIHNLGAAGDTFTNAGTVDGTGGVAFRAKPEAGGLDKLIVDPGAVFNGSIDGGNGLLELASASSVGTLNGFGTSITNFGSLVFDTGADWSIAGNTAGLGAFGIRGFADGDTIDVTDFAPAGSTHTYTPGTGLVLTNGSGSTTLHFGGGTYSTGDFRVTPDSGTGVVVGVACYLAGTAILTPSGEVPVETLAIGDLVATRCGEARPIVWIGRRRYDGGLVEGKRDLLPIRIVAGALGDGVPKRDLYVSPKHALWFDGVLIPAEKLVNGATVCQVEHLDIIEYIHIELESHDVILAEGAAAETFVDCDNRGMFQNFVEYGQLYPNVDVPKWAYCAPLIESGGVLTKVRRKIEERLEALGYTTSVDPDLRLLVDGSEKRPDRVDGKNYLFRLGEMPSDVRILSRTSVPAEVTGSTDIRRLGVNLGSLVLRSDHITCVVEHDHRALIDGYHTTEGTHRWTDGNASIPAMLFDCFGQELTIEVRLREQRLEYRLCPEASGVHRREPICLERV